MEQKEGEPSKDGTTVSPATEAPVVMQGEGASGEEEGKATAERILEEGSPDGVERQERAPTEDGTSAELEGEANGLDEAKVESKGEAELLKEDGGKEEVTVATQEMDDGKEETQLDPKEAALASEKPPAEEKQATLGSGEEARVNVVAEPEPKQATGEQEAKTGAKEADGKEEATAASQEDSDQTQETTAKAQEKASAPEARTDSQAKAAMEEVEDEADVKEESGSPEQEQDQGVERELEEGAGVIPSSPEESLESPTEEGSGLSPGGVGPDTAASGETSPSASESSPSDAPQSPTEPPPAQEKKKEKAPERRVSAPARPRGPRAQNRKAIVDKFGGAASGPTALFRNTKAAGAAIGGVKNMLLEWCRAMTRNYEHVDIQNFSSSWSSGMAFCALIHKFFPDAFDYAALEPTQRRHNFTLAFSTAEKLADCAQLLEVDDMVRLAVPDSKCVYTYIQELYRSLVQKGLVKTKKK
ncbi:smoothelin-like protein 1 isoform X2 [Suricata suricatta]|uniref:Smoothelin like 1 n=2 Tax=Suricata suricatta TaxID=37032 RepID=A0A673U5G5_SURSU|nr:smoothelin-like protein 1 isoform X2 [Suricata suricatta]